MDVAHRLAKRLVTSGTDLGDDDLVTLAAGLLADEAPLAGRHEAQRAVDHLVGLGPLEDLLRDPRVSDVLVNGTGDVWVERDGRLTMADVTFGSAAAVQAAVERVIAPLGLTLDIASPAVDARLPDGSRLHAASPPISVDGPVVAVRRFVAAVQDLDALVAVGGVSPDGAAVLREAVVDRDNILVSGGTGSGKTTLLNILVREIPPTERIVTVEDAAELQLRGHMVRLEARQPNSEGRGEVRLRDLVRHALRLRPDRILIGEVRGSEALDMILAMSTGHDGSMSTVHAGSTDEALWRLETLALSSDRAAAEVSVHRQLRAAVDIVVQMERSRDQRRVVQICRVSATGLDELYAWH